MSDIFKDIKIRNHFKPGDIGYLIHLHGKLYHEGFRFGIGFEIYVAESFAQFYRQYLPEKDKIWICEHGQEIIGFVLMMDRGEGVGQLRFFLIHPDYRHIGLGNELMNRCLAFAHQKEFQQVILWTTDQLPAARHLYQKHGFLLVEEKPSDSFGVTLKEQKYELILSPKP
jgi:N-acetylglutamate synthase-like GNAT family acetyltransferase